MSFTRRLAAGLPVAGVTAFAALALTGAPAVAGDQAAVRAAQPAVMQTPCAAGDRDDDCGYASTAPGATEPTRGGAGYGSTAPTTAPTPTASVDTVPPGGELPTTSPAATPSSPTPGGVSPAGTLPLTGAPMGLTVAVGAVLIAGGVGAVYASRRRRSA
ncbi:hypothetical protein GCM10010435_09540 [Winogradskya consettensis]|uniref:Gram-positive cocci surface proteins LPxTG domain-containing protein n=1 Tax=Winogradskya consettensis TaxID=113560 RepID=A0A919VYS8_9ACTN|nr:LPXTG cell wall anchor domain-containing protein [Actinoplanes consettensis]GIM80712.1 hypothetical protein Aco04nite_72260 [Actinoplanes consettensis]